MSDEQEDGKDPTGFYYLDPPNNLKKKKKIRWVWSSFFLPFFFSLIDWPSGKFIRFFLSLCPYPMSVIIV